MTAHIYMLYPCVRAYHEAESLDAESRLVQRVQAS